MTMNRAQRRALKASMKRRGHVTVTLRGGPMVGWIVKHDAPALRPDWRGAFLEEAARQGHEAYRAQARDSDAQDVPPWEDLTEEEREPYRIIARAQLGAGRYVLRPDGIEAEWQAEL